MCFEHFSEPGTGPRLEIQSSAQFTDHYCHVWRVCWNITGTMLASTGDDGSARIWKSGFYSFNKKSFIQLLLALILQWITWKTGNVPPWWKEMVTNRLPRPSCSRSSPPWTCRRRRRNITRKGPSPIRARFRGISSECGSDLAPVVTESKCEWSSPILCG